MKKITTTFLILMALSSCGDVEGSNPFGEREPTNNETDADGNIIDDDEPYNANFINSSDTVSAKNSANFEDGKTQFQFTNNGELKNVRFARVPNQDGVRLFDAQDKVIDEVSGATITQLNYLALYGQSRSGATEFVIVKTDSYIGEGFGGHIVQRNSFDYNDQAVTYSRPEASQARFDGRYDGFFVSTSNPDDFPLTQSRGDVVLVVDFDDFNDKAGVVFYVSNRQAVAKVPREVGYNIVYTEQIAQLQDISTKVGSGTVDENGKFGVEIFGIDQSENGTVEGYFAGEIPTESVGVLRLTGARLC